MDVSPHPQSPLPSQQEGEGNGELGAPILPPNPEQLGSCLPCGHIFFIFFILHLAPYLLHLHIMHI